MSDYGSRRAFQVIGIISGAVGIAYSTLHYFWLRKIEVKAPTRRASVKSFHFKNGMYIFFCETKKKYKMHCKCLFLWYFSSGNKEFNL